MIYQATKLCFLLFLGQAVNGVKAVGIILLSFLVCKLSLLFLFVNEINNLNIILHSKASLEKQNISFS
jgi:hypothetical protein